MAPNQVVLGNNSLPPTTQSDVQARLQNWRDINSLSEEDKRNFGLASPQSGETKLPNGQSIYGNDVKAALSADHQTLLVAHKPTAEGTTTVITLRLGPDNHPVVTRQDLYAWGPNEQRPRPAEAAQQKLPPDSCRAEYKVQLPPIPPSTQSAKPDDIAKAGSEKHLAETGFRESTHFFLPSGLKVEIGTESEPTSLGGTSQSKLLRIGDYQTRLDRFTWSTVPNPSIVTRENGNSEINFLEINRWRSQSHVNWVQITLGPSADPRTALNSGGDSPGRELKIKQDKLVELGLITQTLNKSGVPEVNLTATDSEIARVLGAQQNELMKEAEPFSFDYNPLDKKNTKPEKIAGTDPAPLEKEPAFSICQPQDQPPGPVEPEPWQHCETQPGTIRVGMFDKIRHISTPTDLPVDEAKYVDIAPGFSSASKGLLVGDYFFEFNSDYKKGPEIASLGKGKGFTVEYWEIDRSSKPSVNWHEYTFGSSPNPDEAVSPHHGAKAEEFDANTRDLLDYSLAQQTGVDEEGTPLYALVASDSRIKDVLRSHKADMNSGKILPAYLPQVASVTEACEQELRASSVFPTDDDDLADLSDPE